MDIIKANEYLCHQYRPLSKGTFNNLEVGAAEGEPIPQSVSPKEASKARVAAYTKAIEKAAQAAAVKAAAVEAAPAEVAAAESVVIESDNGDDKGDNKGNDEDAHAVFEAVEVEDEVIKEAAQEAERFGVNQISLTEYYFITLTPTCRQDLLFIVYI